MLTAHYSNCLEALASELASVAREPLASPFSPEIVIVQSRGVARWLSLRLAEHLGVCANVSFPFPAGFAWDVYRALVPDVPERSPFDPETFAWRIVGALARMEAEPIFGAVREYVQGDELRRYELAQRLASLYDEYTLYRPDWIRRWDRETPEQWQAALWRRLAQECGAPHRAALHAAALKALAAGCARASALPQRVSIFGAPALPPALVELACALSRHCEVHLFLQNPSREYWGDIEDEAAIARSRAARRPAADYLASGNRLLASLGKQGRDFFDLLAGLAAEGMIERDCFVECRETSLLACLKSEILELRENPAGEKRTLADADRSIQIHSCHSAMREVEVLHDQLLALLSDGDLEPSDIVVMTPDIATYAPLVEAVFGTSSAAIPYNVSDRSAEQASTLAGTFMALLDLCGSRYDANTVMGLLDEASVRRRFGLAEADLEIARRWVREARIRWGIDAEHRTRFGVPATHEHTWRFGLDRLLVGYALPGGRARLFEGVLPYDEVEGSLGAIMGRFQSFAESAIALDARLGGARSVREWCALMHETLARFFDPPEDRAEELEAVRACIAVLERDARLADFGDAVSLGVIKTALRERLEPPGRAFLSGGVTFCAMVPMRSLPFEAVCMIGMNDGAFPRVRRRDGFDLMGEDFRRGDRSRRDDDRYLFLESILNARRSLYMSYVGRHIRDDTVMPPSVLVAELLDYLERGWQTPDARPLRERLVTTHPLQPFSRRYFEGAPGLFTYSAEFADAASLAGRGTREPAPLVRQSLGRPQDATRSVDLDTLLRFFRNPARHLFENRLGIRFETAEDEIEAREPFALDGLAAFDLKERLVDLALRGTPHDGYALARAEGALPHGRVGEVVFAEQHALVQDLARRVAPLLPDSVLDPIPIALASGTIQLTGALTRVSSKGLLDYRAARSGANVRVRAWIRHLVLNAFAPAGVGRVTRCVAQDSTLKFFPVEDAREKLVSLLDLYAAGIEKPLHFFPRTSCAYIEHGEINRAVLTVWNGGYDGRPRGEREDPYYEAAFRGCDPLDDAFKAAAHTLFGEMRPYLEEERGA